MSSTLSRVDGVLPRRSLGPMGIISDFYELSKPRIIYLLLITTAAAMIMAARGIPNIWTLLWTLLGGGLASASAGAFNCIVDSAIDGLMRRTCARPIPTGRMSIRSAAIYAVATGIISFAILIYLVNPLSAWLSLAGNVYYVVIYTMLLKRITPLNIVIGGAAGAIPPLVGWAAVTGHIGGPALGLFAVIFLWTPPHFWSLALMTEIDYDKAKIPMLPNVSGVARTKLEILIYSIVLAAATIALYYPLHIFGWIYLLAAGILGAVFIYGAVRILTQEGKIWPRWLFKFSLLYLALMCLVMVIDRIVG